MFVDDHHGDGILELWCPAFNVQEELLESSPTASTARPTSVRPGGSAYLNQDVG